MTAQQANALTNKNMMNLFGVSHVTIFNWRKGTPQREQLPTVQVGNSIRYPVVKVKAWAKSHGIEMLMDPQTLVGTGVLKPGPKKTGKATASAGRDKVSKAKVRGSPSKAKKKA